MSTQSSGRVQSLARRRAYIATASGPVPGFRSLYRYLGRPEIPRHVRARRPQRVARCRIPGRRQISAKYQPSPQRTKIGTSRAGLNHLRNAYRQIFPMHTNPFKQTAAMAPFLQMGRIDVSAAIEEEFNAWYNTAYIPGYLGVPGCLGARRFVAVEGQPKSLPCTNSSMPWLRRAMP